MHIHKTKQVRKLVEEIIESYYECDKCGERIESKYGNAFDMDFEVTTGYIFPGNGHGERYKMDLCEPCSMALIDDLKKQGYRINESEWDS